MKEEEKRKYHRQFLFCLNHSFLFNKIETIMNVSHRMVYHTQSASVTSHRDPKIINGGDKLGQHFIYQPQNCESVSLGLLMVSMCGWAGEQASRRAAAQNINASHSTVFVWINTHKSGIANISLRNCGWSVGFNEEKFTNCICYSSWHPDSHSFKRLN